MNRARRVDEPAWDGSLMSPDMLRRRMLVCTVRVARWNARRSDIGDEGWREGTVEGVSGGVKLVLREYCREILANLFFFRDFLSF